MKKSKKLLSAFLALIMSFGMFTGFASTAFAASSGTAYMIEMPRGSDPNKGGWGHDALNLMGSWKMNATTKDVSFLYAIGSYNGPIAYCIEPGVPLNTGDTFSGRDESYWDNYPSGYNPTINPRQIKANIGRILQYGYNGNLNTNWNTSNSGDANAVAHAIATQLLIWETVVGERDSQFNHVWGSSQGKNNIIDTVRSNHPLRDLIFSYYNSMEDSVQRHSKLPSFFSGSASAGAYELKWTGTNYSVTITDHNNVLGNYNFTSNQAGINISVSGNQMTISCDTAPKGNISITANKKNGTRYGLVTWTDGNVGGGDQDLVSYSASVSDPVQGYLNLEVKTGNMSLVKTSEDGKVGGISFTITGEGFNGVRTTDASGNIYITDLNPGIYTVTEHEIDKYIPTATQRVTIVSGQTSSIAFNNVLKRGELKVVKTSEDSLVEGMTFKLSGMSLAEIPIELYAVTDVNGVATFKDVLISGSTPYILEEIDTPIRYVVPEAQNVAIEWNKVTDKTISNILKKFRVTVTKSDVETGLPQGDASLAGATYGIYKDTTLIDSYTTDVNGQFTTNYYICGYDWNIREIHPSEGYLIDNTIHKVGAEPELYTIELNTTANDVTEQVIKGNMALIKHTDDGSTQIETPEAGAEFAVFLKASGSYDNAKETERDYLVCDENGYAATKSLPYGIYTVRQTKGWEGTEFMADFDLYIAQDGVTYRYLINNAPFTSYIKLVKKDIETGNTIPYAGSGFQIYDPQDNLATMSFTYPTPTTIDTFYTNAEGYLVTPEKLPYGGGYTLVEVQAPYGYVLDSTPLHFDVIPENSEDDDSGITLIVVEKLNMAQKGTISISKSGEVFATVVSSENIYQPVYEIQGLAGAVYEITALEDIYTLDGTLRASAGQIVDTITTDETGTATSGLLYLGKYSVKEITAPFGMTINDEAHNVELVYAGQEVDVTTTDTSFYNERQKVEIDLIKQLETDERFNVGMGNEILDVTFGIFARAELKALDGTVIPVDGLIEIVGVNADGKATLNTDLPLGSYYVKEVATNKAYILNDTEYDVTFEYAGQGTTLVRVSVNDGIAIENTLIRGDITGIKVDETDEPLSDAVIGLFKAYETVFNKDTAILTTTSADDGSFSFVDVPYGSYIVREIEAPKGYVLSDTNFVVSITGCDESEELLFAIVNKAIRGNVTLTKVDTDYPDNKLTGAEFEVYEDTNGNKEFDKDDVLIGTMEELSDGVYTLEELLYGGYFVKETKAPTGFILDTKAYYFEIVEDGKTVIVENEAGKGFINNAQKGNIQVKKTSADGVLEGFTFRVEGVDVLGNAFSKYYVTDANGEIYVIGLRIGTYTIRELETDKTKHYQLPSSQTVIIENDKTVTVKFFNDLKGRPEVPQTGDTTNAPLWIVLAFISLAGIGATTGIYFVKKRKEDNE
ncbi:MAG: TonB-dependent receptor [Clostridia bacterium]|nr:TonB-dependent receptor [Clostridia bacterium]